MSDIHHHRVIEITEGNSQLIFHLYRDSIVIEVWDYDKEQHTPTKEFEIGGDSFSVLMNLLNE